MNKLLVIFMSVVFLSCSNKKQTDSKKTETITYQNKGQELVFKMIDKVGSYQTLSEKKDVVYTYTYQTPDGKTDVSTEKYIFNGELSYGEYKKHERTLPGLEGVMEQGYDGGDYWLKNNGKIVEDAKALNKVRFNRPTNFYWFTMFQKLADPGVLYDYLGKKSIDDIAYDIVKISFKTEGDTPTDIYQLYINSKTKLVDQFLFTVVDYGVVEKPLLMRLKYQAVDGILIPSSREYKKSTWDADISDKPWIKVNWTNIRFDNGLRKTDFKK